MPDQALNSCFYYQILCQFFEFTQTLKRSRVFDDYALAPCVVQVLRNDLTRRCICKSDNIALQIIHVVSRDVTLLDADPRTGAVVEEPHHVATGLLREYLSAVEQILSLRAVHGLAASYPVRRVGVELAEDTVGN